MEKIPDFTPTAQGDGDSGAVSYRDRGAIPYLGHLFERAPGGMRCSFCNCLNGSYDGAYECRGNPSQTPLHQTPYELALETLATQLIITAGVKYGVQPNVLPQSTERFRIIARMAVALVDTNALQRIKLEVVAFLTDDRHTVRDVEGFAREVVDETIGKLMDAGGAR